MGEIYGKYCSPLGEIVIACKDNAVSGLWFCGQKYFMSTAECKEPVFEENETLRNVKIWLDRYFGGEKPSPYDLELKPCGSEFRQRVWKMLLEIPYGETVTYGELAKTLGTPEKKMSAQAVGGAVGHNPISIIIPCHRVLGVGGKMTGYAAGIDVKIQLLKHEGYLL